MADEIVNSCSVSTLTSRTMFRFLFQVYLQQFSEEECSRAYPANRNLQRGFDQNIQSCYGDKDHVINTCQVCIIMIKQCNHNHKATR